MYIYIYREIIVIKSTHSYFNYSLTIWSQIYHTIAISKPKPDKNPSGPCLDPRWLSQAASAPAHKRWPQRVPQQWRRRLWRWPAAKRRRSCDRRSCLGISMGNRPQNGEVKPVKHETWEISHGFFHDFHRVFPWISIIKHGRFRLWKALNIGNFGPDLTILSWGFKHQTILGVLRYEAIGESMDVFQ